MQNDSCHYFQKNYCVGGLIFEMLATICSKLREKLPVLDLKRSHYAFCECACACVCVCVGLFLVDSMDMREHR